MTPKRFPAIFFAAVFGAGILRADDNTIEGVNVQAVGKFTKVVIQSSQPVKIREVAQPDGVVIYMTSPITCRRPAVEKVFSDLIEEIRYGYKDDAPVGHRSAALDYIQVKLKEPADYTITQKDWILAVEFRPKGRGRPIAAGKTTAPATFGKKSAGQAVLPPNPGLKDFLEVGWANHAPLRIAGEEYSLARWRYAEASRALGPSITGKFEESNGRMAKDITTSLDDVAFRRKEMGLQFGQPLFQSGRLVYSLRQAGNQKRAASENLRKARADLTFEITRAYYNLLKAQTNLKSRRELNERTKKIVELARRKKQLELITEADLLGSESLYSKIYYRLLSDEKDLEISWLKMAALLNVSAMPESLPDPDPVNPNNLLELSMPVDALIDLAMANRPEMLASEYNARAQVNAEKAARADTLLKIDASGFYGRAAGAFESDPFQLRPSWNAGVQASLYFAGNSVKATGTGEKTVPDFGETTATQIRGKTLSVGLLDNMRARGDLQQAQINRDKAVSERDQMRRGVEVDVREAFYNLQKAKLQIKGAQYEMDFRSKELFITRQKERMAQVEPQQTLIAEGAYGDGLSDFEEAKAFYRVSLSQLEKAVGMPLDSIPEFR